MSQLQELQSRLVATEAAAWRETSALRHVANTQAELLTEIGRLLGVSTGDADGLINRLRELVAHQPTPSGDAQ